MSSLQRVMYNHMQTSGVLLTEDKVINEFYFLQNNNKKCFPLL